MRASSAGAPAAHPTRSPGASNLENVPRWMTQSCRSSALIGGIGTPSKRTLRYGLSSMMRMLVANGARSISAWRRCERHRQSGRIVKVRHVVDEFRHGPPLARELVEKRGELADIQPILILRPTSRKVAPKLRMIGIALK